MTFLIQSSVILSHDFARFSWYIPKRSEELLKNLSNFPIMFKSLNGSVNDYEIPKITYNEFLKELKTACDVIGLNSTLFGTHSLRGRSNDFESYIDHTVLFELQLQTIQPTK
jgi:hypothetical protein